MNLEQIVNKAYKTARRKAPSAELTIRGMEHNYPVQLQLSAIRKNFMDRFVINSINMLHKKLPKYPLLDSKRYLELLYDALRQNGARIINSLQTDYMIIYFGNLNYGIGYKKNGIILCTNTMHDSVKIYPDPLIVAKFLAMIHAYPIDDTIYEEIFRESCALYKIKEIVESSVHKLIDDILESHSYSVRLMLCGTKRFKILFSRMSISWAESIQTWNMSERMFRK